MTRTYSDPSYGSKKILKLETTGALNGTRSSATEIGATRCTVMQPITITDMNSFFVAGGTTTTNFLVVNSSLAGTGAAVPIGTISAYTQAINTVLDGSVVSGTAANLSTGDDIYLTAYGTTTTVEDIQVTLQYRENFVQSDS